MEKKVKYLIFKMIADAVREGHKAKDIKDVDNLDSAIAYKVLKNHNIDPESAWMFEDRDYLDEVDDDLYSMMDISLALIETQKETIEDLQLDYDIEADSSSLVKNMVKDALTVYMFNTTDYLKDRSSRQEKGSK